MTGNIIEDLNVLVVADSHHYQQTILEALRNVRIRGITTAGDGVEAVKLLAPGKFDIVICGKDMAPVSGLRFVRSIRTSKNSPNPYVPIIMVCDINDEQDVIQARDIGVTEILAKPLNLKALAKRIEAIIARPRDFVKSPVFTGPSRRRKEGDKPAEDRRSG